MSKKQLFGICMISSLLMISCGNSTNSANDLSCDSVAPLEEDFINEEDTEDQSSNTISFTIGSIFSIDGTTVYIEENRQKYICIRSNSKLTNNQMMAIYERAPKENVYFFDHICTEYRTGEDDYAAVMNSFGSLTVFRFDLDETIKKENLNGYDSYNPIFE